MDRFGRKGFDIGIDEKWPTVDLHQKLGSNPSRSKGPIFSTFFRAAHGVKDAQSGRLGLGFQEPWCFAESTRVCCECQMFRKTARLVPLMSFDRFPSPRHVSLCAGLRVYM